MAAINPGASEVCGNTIDDNCNGQVDENMIRYFRDADADTYGTSASVLACTLPNGFALRTGDCNDGVAAINPGATEVCDQIDNNCNGTTDEGLLVVRFRDADGDTYGTAQQGNVCPNDAGWATRQGDCNDTNRAINPGVAEVCGDNIDNNCDSQIDENKIQVFLDRDGDSYGEDRPTLSCTVPNGYANRGGDCVDTNANINPGRAEVCNETDDNCNTQIDEGLPTSRFFLDADSDTYGAGGAVRAAVVRSGSNYAAAPEVAAQLNDDTYQDFTATVVSVSQIDTAAELANFDVVVLGDSGYNEDEFTTTFADALNTWIRAGGGLISTGWVDYSLTSDAVGTAMDVVIPTDVVPYGYAYCSSPSLSITGGAHEITAGLPGSFALAGAYVEFSPLALDIPGAVTLGVAGGSCTDGGTRSALVAADLGLGRTVYMGALFMAREVAYGTAGLRGGVYDRLFEQTVKWAGKGGGSSIVACRGRGNFTASRTGDCNDGNVAINPGATEVCNFIDDNCVNGVDEGLQVTRFRDVDGDNYGTSQTASVCPTTTGYAVNTGDCNDANVAINPGVAEICGDNIDNNCNSQIDENILTFFRDTDGDGFGNESSPAQACVRPNGYVAIGRDCVDTDANINPNVAEVCNGIDDNCNTTIDEGLPTRQFFLDVDNDTYGTTATVTNCRAQGNFRATRPGDCNDGNANVNPGQIEVCANDVDDNCNGTVDEGTLTWYRDADSDRFGNPTSTTRACIQPNGYVSNNTDCDDGRANVNPGATEVCDDLDNNCNTTVDEGLRLRRNRDADGDTYGTTTTALVCPQWTGWADREGDCNDSVGAINPGAAEVCGNGIDDNCDSQIDENILTWYLDADSDTYGSSLLSRACTQPNGYVARSGDCNDGNANVNPGRTEVCTGIDDTCAGGVDEGLLVDRFRDADLDGFGSNRISQVCPNTTGYSTRTGDCDDSRNFIFPGATELCGNDLDDNCDGRIDENKLTFFRDFDADNYGNVNNSGLFCTRPNGYVADSTDCNDGVATINPGASERCNATDDNCNPTIDEGNPDAGAACSTGLPGACAAESTTICLGGSVVCGPNDANGYGTGENVTFPAGLLGRSNGVVNTDWKMITSNGVFLFNLAFGRNGGEYNGYTIRVFNPSNNFALVKEFQVGTTANYIDGISAKGDVLYAIQWTGGNGARVTEINWRTEQILRDTTHNQGSTQAIEGQYDWINDLHWLGSLSTPAIYEHRGTEISAASLIRTFDAQGYTGGAGAVASDGRFLYVKRWATYPGSDNLVRIGTGYNNTVRGVNYGTISGVPATISTTYHSDGYLYVGSAGSPNVMRRIKITAPRQEICNDGIDNNCNGGQDDYCPSPTPYDTFNSGLVRCDWSLTSSHGNATAPVVENGVLKSLINTSVSGQPTYVSGLTSRFNLTGDFDVEVDYRLVRWHRDSGIRVNLAAAGGTAHRLNERGGNEFFVANLGGQIGTFVPTNQTEGKLRMVRTGGTLITYYNDAGWREFSRRSGMSTGPTPVTLSIHGHNALPGDIEVHFDNFTVRGGNIGQPPGFGPEVCDGQDNDCNGQTDENSSVSCSTQCGTGVRACVNGQLDVCSARVPSAELCDDTVDNDCNGQTDEFCGGFSPFDDFNDNNIAACRWRTSTSPAYDQGADSGVRVDETGGNLRVRVARNTRGTTFLGNISSRFGVEGDFDVQIDYALPVWPSRNHVRVGLIASGGGQAASVQRTADRNQGDTYVSDIAGNVAGWRPTAARNGRLRLVRSGNIVRTFTMDGLGGSWIQNSAAAFNTATINLVIQSWGHDFVPGDVEVTYDNLAFNGCSQTPCRSWAGGRLVSFGGVGTPEGAFDQSTCDGLDNDCDGLTDGFNRACSTLCGAGTETCNLGNWGVCSARAPITEICDGADNDCDGTVDESDPNENTFCVVSGQQGVCAQGTRVCRGGQGLVCTGPRPGTETCDGPDNDCDGTTDEVGSPPTLFSSTDVVGYWSFDEASGSNFRDNAGVNNSGVVARDARLGRAGRYGKGLELDGNQDYGEVAADNTELDFDSRSAITIAGWFNPRQHAARSFTVYRNDSYYLTMLNGRPAFYGYGLSNPGYHTATTALALNTWSHVAATYDGTNVRIYINGNQVHQAATSGSFRADTTPLIFGHKTTSLDDAFNGFIDEVVIARRALTQNEIRSIMSPEMPGGGVQCNTGNLGVCQAGVSACTNGAFTCGGASPRAELCDGLDNDCDGTSDEGNPQGGGTCLTGNPGVCRTGAFLCTGGALICNAPQPGSITEVCDGADNDCDGSTDESFPTQGNACSTGRQGVCATGSLACVGGAQVCSGPQPTTELCDNRDNDCDGQTDETLTRACSTICGGGTETCSVGNWGGCSARQPTAEICDGADNDCDGATDESIRRSCRTDCGGGTQLCSSGTFGDCSAPLPSSELCDGLDNNCNGFIDDSVDCGCQYFPRDEPVRPALEWMWTASDTEPDHVQVMMTPIVGPLVDSNNDGRINESDVPAVLFTATTTNHLTGGILRAVRGSDGQELWSYTDRKVYGASSPALGDLDDDGVPEVVAYAWRDIRRGAPQNAGLIALDNAGNELWNNTDVNRGGHVEMGSPAIANIDPNSAGNEIASCFWLVSATGRTLWDVWGDLPDGHTPRGFCSPAVADIDNDGRMEIVIGARAYNHDGSVAWTNTNLYAQWGLDYDIAPAIADLDGNGTPEVIVVRGAVYVLDGATGALLAQSSLPGGGQGGAPNVADFDGDGLPEIGTAGGSAYAVFKMTRVNNVPTINVLWQRQTRDFSSNVSGSSVFDFNGDGIADVVYNDELFLRVYNGRTGEVTFESRNWSGTQVEYPVIADVDNDGNAEIIVGRNQIDNNHDDYGNYDGTPLAGLRVYGDSSDNWVNTRSIWNQYSYHITNVNDNGSIPTTEVAGWTRRNSNGYRNNFQGDQGLFAAPDLEVSLQGQVVQGSSAGNYPNTQIAYCPAFNRLTLRVCNSGDVAVPAGVQVGVYLGHPSNNVLVASVQTTNRLETSGNNNCQDIGVEWNSRVAGNHEIFAHADFENNQNECDEDNNIRSLGTHLLRATEEEKCDAVDNDCNAQMDENLTRTCTTQCGSGTQTCSIGEWGTCSTPEPTNEVCNGIDDDCDGTVDESEEACPDNSRCVNDNGSFNCIDALTVEDGCNGGCPLGFACSAEMTCEPYCESNWGCPSGQVCQDNACVTDDVETGSLDQEVDEDRQAMLATPLGACSASTFAQGGGAPAGGLGLLALLGLGLLVIRRRR